ncbi:ABC transporter permease [Vibrio sp. JC009]|uniref:ABC transporter permease n=1 Tax=Vibrio sp. JC009 TaxID=2912314 RepID=UPI0023B121D5|nr:ABC transporter permease [Vibrio sp. JC009]WED23379.1 ABC transporter permease [Vibrio sp. JC009]
MLFSPALRAQIIKEFLCILHDKKTRIILVAPPLLQLVIFAYAITLDVYNVNITVFNQDNGYYSRQFLDQVSKADFVGHVASVYSYREVEQRMNQRQSLVSVIVPSDFSKALSSGENPQVQVISDGRRANAAQVVTGYIQSISQQFISRVNPAQTTVSPVTVRHWFNSNLNYQWFVVPGLSGVLSMVIALLLTALSIARERELGTFEQLLVSPCHPGEIIAAKTIPPLIVGYVLGNLMIAAGVFLFHIPFMGSFWWLQLALIAFLISTSSLGLMISAVSNTQQQAILGCFAIVVPLMLMSGFATPVANMPEILQHIAYWLPIQHYLIIVQGIFLKALPAAEVIAHIIPMGIVALVSLPVASILVRSRLA